jgi:hypothetical protein
MACMMVPAAAGLQNENKPASFVYLYLWTGTMKEAVLEHLAVSNSATCCSWEAVPV